MDPTGRIPADRFEAEVASIMGVALGRTFRIPPDDSFFDLGGTSITAVAVAGRLTEAFGLPVDAADVMTWSQPSALAEELRRRWAERGAVTRPAGHGTVLVLPHEADVGLLRFVDADVLRQHDPYPVSPSTEELHHYRDSAATVAVMLRDLGATAESAHTVVGYCCASPIALELAHALAARPDAPSVRAVLIDPTPSPRSVMSLETLFGTELTVGELAPTFARLPPEFRSDTVPMVRVDDPEALYPLLRAAVAADWRRISGVGDIAVSVDSAARLADAATAYVRQRLAAAGAAYRPGLDVNVLMVEGDERLEYWATWGDEVTITPTREDHEHIVASTAVWKMI
jgi:acyl carrier protein